MGLQLSKPPTKRPFLFHIAVGSEGAAALVSADQQDNYRTACTQDRANILSRETMNYSANRLSLAEADVLTERIQTFTIPEPLHTLNPTVVALMPSADGGMPHTRAPNIICLPQSAAALTNETFVHELWHLHQRSHYSTWTRFFREKWNFVPFEGKLPPHLKGVVRFNPDTMQDPLWIWNQEWVPICVFLNPVTPSLKYTSIWFYNVKSRIHWRQPPRELAAFFSSSLTPSAYEHPCETAAYMLADGCDSCPAYKALKEVFVNNPSNQ
jgi:hypothetical protein